ncbi:MAG: ABC transporter permease, partial [Pseudomonadales bacterium]|nr:ABC transporter permease [Pseudomonadales bacterium]
MLKNYLITALNSLWKNRLYSLINIFGLAVGLAACVLITLFVRDELSYDQHWSNAGSLYRLNMTFSIPNQEPVTAGWVPGRALPSLDSFFRGQYEAATRTLPIDVDIKIANNAFNEEIIWVDPQFNDLFDLEVMSGSITDTLQDTNSIALSDELAIRLFGNESAVGEILTMVRGETTKDYRVTGVYRTPDNTMLSLPAVTLLDETEFQREPTYFNNWFSQSMHTFLLIESENNRAIMESQFPEFTAQNIVIPQGFGIQGLEDASEIISFELQPVTNIRLDGRTVPEVSGTRLTILIFSSISVLVLLIGAINFMILTVARASQRSREVAMRKTLGARRGELIFQFLGESILLTLFATMVALVIAEALMPLL